MSLANHQYQYAGTLVIQVKNVISRLADIVLSANPVIFRGGVEGSSRAMYQLMSLNSSAILRHKYFNEDRDQKQGARSQ